MGFNAKNWDTFVLRHGIFHPYVRFIPQWPRQPYLAIELEARRVHCRIQLWYEGLLHKQRARAKALRLRWRRPAVFEFQDLDQTDAEILEKIKKWRKGLKKDLPTHSQKHETRGRRTLESKCKVALKALGAWRLWKLGGLSQNEVIYHAERYERHLYKNQPELSKVLRETESHPHTGLPELSLEKPVPALPAKRSPSWP